MLYRLDLKKMFSVLNVGKQKITDKMIKSAEEVAEKVDDICANPGKYRQGQSIERYDIIKNYAQFSIGNIYNNQNEILPL